MLRIRSILVILLLSATQADGTWLRVHQFTHPGTCGYFFNKDHGFVGFGDVVSSGWTTAGIVRTSDGGQTWTDCSIPTTRGRLTSIYMQSALIGYASVMYSNTSLWQTTDGGVTWRAFAPSSGLGATCTYATQNALIRTMWYDVGGVSTNAGNTFSQVFLSRDGNDQSNGIDFLDELNGVVTMGPDGSGFGAPNAYTYYTSNGGQTWTRGGLMHESWGVYADRSIGAYLAMAEDDANFPGNTLYWSRDGGKNWSPRYGFGALEFTGHIAGRADATYIQTSTVSNANIGLLRSDDHGLTWRKIGGPSNERDTRFFVTGCRGEVVYAFDNQGGIWRTTDGGDGTLLPAPYIGKIASAPPDRDVLIPVYYDTLPAPATMSELSGSFSLNDDLLSPDSLELNQTQLQNLALFDTVIQTSPGHWTYDIILKPKTILNGSQTLPLLYIHARTFVTDSVETEVTLDSAFTRNGGAPTPLVTCSSTPDIDAGKFSLLLSCGDSTLVQYLRGVSITPTFSVYPNPTRDELHLVGVLPVTLEVESVLYDIEGRALVSNSRVGNAGSFEQTISNRELTPGTYVLRVRTSGPSTHTLKIVIDR